MQSRLGVHAQVSFVVKLVDRISQTSELELLQQSELKLSKRLGVLIPMALPGIYVLQGLSAEPLSDLQWVRQLSHSARVCEAARIAFPRTRTIQEVQDEERSFHSRLCNLGYAI